MIEHIADTGPLIGWINRKDQWHDWTVATLESLQPPLITCEAVIAEAAWSLGKSREAIDRLFDMIDVGALRIVELLPEHAPHMRALVAKYPQMDFCDAAIVRLSEIFPRAKVVTVDSADFTVYRRFGNKHLDLIHPKIK